MEKLRNMAAGCVGSKGEISLSPEDMRKLPSLKGTPAFDHVDAPFLVKCEDFVAAVQLADLESAEKPLEVVDEKPPEKPPEP